MPENVYDTVLGWLLASPHPDEVKASIQAALEDYETTTISTTEKR